MFCFYYSAKTWHYDSTNISPIFNAKKFLYDIHFIRDSTWLLFYSWIIVSFHHFDNFLSIENTIEIDDYCYVSIFCTQWNKCYILIFHLNQIMIINIYNKIKWQTYIMDVQVEFGLWSVNSFINCQEVHHGILSRINCKLHVFSRLIRTISICWNVYLLKKKKWCIKACIR